MGQPELSPQELQNLRDLAFSLGKIISKRAFGEQGPSLDTDFQPLETLAQIAAQGILEGALSVSLEQQSQQLEPIQYCPKYQKTLPTQTPTSPHPNARRDHQLHRTFLSLLGLSLRFFPSEVSSQAR